MPRRVRLGDGRGRNGTGSGVVPDPTPRSRVVRRVPRSAGAGRTPGNPRPPGVRATEGARIHTRRHAARGLNPASTHEPRIPAEATAGRTRRGLAEAASTSTAPPHVAASPPDIPTSTIHLDLDHHVHLLFRPSPVFDRSSKAHPPFPNPRILEESLLLWDPVRAGKPRRWGTGFDMAPEVKAYVGVEEIGRASCRERV